MGAIDFVMSQFRSYEENEEANVGNKKLALSVRLPIETIAWLDVFKANGLGGSRNDVVCLMLELAIEQVRDKLGDCCDVSDFEAEVQQMIGRYELKEI
jgi:hypothetical protein